MTRQTASVIVDLAIVGIILTLWWLATHPHHPTYSEALQAAKVAFPSVHYE